MQDSIHQWANWIAGLYYVCHCLEALATLPDVDRPHVVAFVPENLVAKFRESFDFEDCDWIDVISIADSYLETTAGLSDLTELVASQKCEILFPAISPPCVTFPGKIIAWITDYQHKYYPEFFSAAECTFRNHLFSFMTAIASRIVCSSETVRQDMERFYPSSQNRGVVLRFTTSPPPGTLDVDTRETLRRLQINGPYAYLPYQFWKHKNHWTVFRAWEKLAASGHRYQLVCSGSTNDSRSPEHFSELTAYLEKTRLTKFVRILGMIPRGDQWQLYRGAKFILQPSLFEGWSTSVEEARCLGKPVLLSEIPIHREQLGDTGFFFDPTNVHSLAKLIEEKWLELPDGLDLEREKNAIQGNPMRLEAFGKELLTMFSNTSKEITSSIAADVLPLYLYYQREAKDRLQIVNQMQEYITYLQGAAATGSSTIKPVGPVKPIGPESQRPEQERHVESKSVRARSWLWTRLSRIARKAGDT